MSGHGSDFYDDSNEISTLDGDLRIGEFLVRPLLKQVVRLGEDGAPREEHSLPDKAMGVLVYLAENARQVCEREDILDAVWGEDRDAYDRVLDNAVAEIRRVFGDDARKPSYVQTVPRVGYRLLIPLSRTVASSESEAETVPSATSAMSVSRLEGSAAKEGISSSQWPRRKTSALLLLALGGTLMALLPDTPWKMPDNSKVHVGLRMLGEPFNKPLVSRSAIEKELFESHPCGEESLLRPTPFYRPPELVVRLTEERELGQSTGSASVSWPPGDRREFARLRSGWMDQPDGDDLREEHSKRLAGEVRFAVDRLLCRADTDLPAINRACHCLNSAESPDSAMKRPVNRVKSLEMAIDLDPTLLPAYSDLATAYLRMSEQQKARDVLEVGLAQVENLDSVEGLELRFNLAMAVQDAGSARALIAQLADAEPDNWQHILRMAKLNTEHFGSCDEPLELLNTLEKRNPEEVSIVIARAETLGRCRNGEESVRVLRSVLESRSFDSRILKSLIPSLVHLDRLKEAENYAQRLLALQPSDPGSYWFLGGIAADAGRYSEARKWLQLAKELGPWPIDLGYIYWYEAYLAEMTLDFSACVEASRSAAALIPRHKSRIREGEISCLVKNDELDAASAMLAELRAGQTERDGSLEKPGLLLLEAVIELASENGSKASVKESVEKLSKAIEQSRANSDIEYSNMHSYSAGESTEQVDWHLAEGFYKGVTKESRYRKGADCRLGLLYQKQGRFEDAISRLSDAVRAYGMHPEDPLGMECAEALTELDPTFTIAN